MTLDERKQQIRAIIINNLGVYGGLTLTPYVIEELWEKIATDLKPYTGCNDDACDKRLPY